jgi:hypothetical protein
LADELNATLLTPAEDEVSKLLALPDDIALAGHVSVGHRADPWPTKLSRKPLSEFAFGEPW